MPRGFPTNYSEGGPIPNPERAAMLLALCHRCWTWIEPKRERCVECGSPVDLQEPDPDLDELKTLLGESLGVIGEFSLKRPGLPSFGALSAFEHGLLFLPDLRQLPSGGLTAVELPPGGGARRHRPGFWSLFSRTLTAEPNVRSVVREKLTAAAAAERLIDSPGGLFVRRETILRVIQRGTMLRVERKPGRTLAWRTESSLAAVHENVRRLQEHAAWSKAPWGRLG